MSGRRQRNERQGNERLDRKLFADPLDRLQGLLTQALKPVPRISITEWAEQNLVLPPKVTSEPGPYSIERTPYLREIMDCLHPDSPYNEIIVYSGTQLGKTQSILNSICFNIINAPAGMLFGFSDTEEMRKMIQNRFDPLVDANPAIRERIFSQRGGRSGDTLAFKDFPGGDLSFATGQSASPWLSNPRRYVYIDEADAIRSDLGGRGDVFELAKDRTSTYRGREKIYMSSTVTNGDSRIEREYASTDMRKFFVPCPECGKLQLIDFSRFEWRADGELVHEVWMVCEGCGHHIHNHDKVTMLPSGVWMPTNPNPTPKNKAGFWISGLYAPVGWQDWEGCVATYLKALKSPDSTKMVAFFNSILAQQYTETSEVPKWERLYNLSRGSGYVKGQIPSDVVFLTSGSDVQLNRIETEVVGWCRNGRSRSIQTYQFFCAQGETTESLDSRCWSDYRDAILEGVWTRDDGIQFRTVQNLLDKNYNTPQVNAFWESYCKMEEARGCGGEYRLTLVRGRDDMKDILSPFKLDKPGRKGMKARSKSKQRTNGVYMFVEVGVSNLKRMIYGALSEDDDAEGQKPNIMMFPSDYPEEYFKQLTAERYYPPDSTHKRGYWRKERDRNEALDMKVYNWAAWYLIGAYGFTAKDYDDLQGKFAQKKEVVSQNRQQARRKVLSRGGVW